MYPENLAIKVLSIHGRIEVTKVTARAYDILFTSFLFFRERDMERRVLEHDYMQSTVLKFKEKLRKSYIHNILELWKQECLTWHNKC